MLFLSILERSPWQHPAAAAYRRAWRYFSSITRSWKVGASEGMR